MLGKMARKADDLARHFQHLRNTALVGIEPGAPGLLIERRGFLDDGRAVEMTQSWYRGDAYDFVAELNALG